MNSYPNYVALLISPGNLQNDAAMLQTTSHHLWFLTRTKLLTSTRRLCSSGLKSQTDAQRNPIQSSDPPQKGAQLILHLCYNSNIQTPNRTHLDYLINRKLPAHKSPGEKGDLKWGDRVPQKTINQWQAPPLANLLPGRWYREFPRGS